MSNFRSCAVFLVLALGCSGKPATPVVEDPSYDSTKASQLLTEALNAWKQGRTAELARRATPIRFADDDLTHGFQLVDFQFADPNQAVAPYKDVAVKLTLRGRDGKTIERTATYQVLLSPKLAVLRGDS